MSELGPGDSRRNSQRPLAGTLLDRLYRDHSVSLVAWLRRRFGEGPPEPEDIAQAAFTKFSSLDSVEDIQNHRAFLFTIASNLAVSAIRSNVRARAFLDAETAESANGTENITPLRVYEAKEDVARLNELFEKLTARQKEIVVRSRLLGQTYTQIKADKGWSLGTIASDMKAALLVLAEVNEDEGGGPR